MASALPSAAPSMTGDMATALHQSSGGISAGGIFLLAIALLLLLGCLAWALLRLTAIEPRWALTLRHCAAEAAHRASCAWAELGDWMRLGH
jgi:hypothetical protein